jgi:peptidoglycan/xylan/chitin deacetylase (PgdA/CDA1 family)
MYPDEPDTATFRRIIEWIDDLCCVLPLEVAVDALRADRLPARAAAITFDDGYLNNLTVAKPLLEEVGLPATIFVAVDPVREGIMWNDLLIEAARTASADADLGDFGLPPFRCREDRVVQMQAMISALKPRCPAQRWEWSCEIYRRLVGTPRPRLMMTEEDLARIGGSGIDVGAHTITHPILTSISDEVAREEIAGSRRWIAERIGRSPRLFAYPNGIPDVDYVERHVAMVREAGFDAAVSTRWAAAGRRSSLFELPRFTPWERDAGGFASRLVKVCVRSYV